MKFVPKKNSVCLAITATLISASIPTVVMAQGSALEEVVVTAQRRTESAQDVPVAITAIDGSAIQDMGYENANDITRQIPNMNVSNPYGDTQPIFSIRGISMSDYSPNQSSPIGVYVDEAYLGAIYTHGLNFFDTERIEALRGPQGTLYGKNTTGGAVNIISNTPQINDPVAGYVTVGAGDYSMRSVQAAAEATLVDDFLAARIALTYKEDDGFVDNKTTGDELGTSDYQAVRLTLNSQLTESFNAVLKLTTGENDSKVNPPRNEGRYNGTNTDITGYTRPSSLDFYDVESNREGKLEVELDQLVLKLSYEADNYSIVSVTSAYDSSYFQGQDTDGSPLTLLETDWSTDTESISQDLRYVSNFDGPINFVAGVYYGREEADLANLYTLYGDPTLELGFVLNEFGQVDQTMETTKETLAAYGQFRFELTDRLGMDIGLRYTRDENTLDHLNISRLNYDGSSRGSWVPGNTTQGTANPIDNPFDFNTGIYTDGVFTRASAPELDETEGEWTGKVGLDYAFNDELMGYLSYNRGFRSGSFNSGAYFLERPLETAYAEPEFVNAYEIGTKIDFLDGRARLNAAAFFYDYQDQQFINVVGVSNFLENAGGAEVLGAEVELWLQPVDHLVIQASLGVLDTEYTDLTLADTSTLFDLDDEVDLSGNELISAPAVNFNIAVDYDFVFANSAVLRPHVDAVYLDDQWFSAYNDDLNYGEIKQDAYWIYNARLTLLLDDERYMIAAWAKNLTDEEYDTYGINLQASFGYDYLFPGAPRRYGVEFSYRF